MPVAYYIIPMVSGPYSRSNPQRPAYVDDIRCNWTGHNVDDLGIYVCKVNTSEAKHTDLNGRAQVFQLRFDWDTVISTMTLVQRTAISNWCSNKGIAYDATETIGQFLMRVINSGLFSLGNTATGTEYQNLTQAQKDRINALCDRWSISRPTSTETVKSLSSRCGSVWWNAPQLTVEEF